MLTTLTKFLASSVFNYFMLPLLTTSLSVFLKTTSRNDRYAARLAKEDFAVGLQISLTAIVAFITHTGRLAQVVIGASQSGGSVMPHTNERLLVAPWLILLLIIGLWGISTLIRKFGWKSQTEMTWCCGIIVPLLYGIACLIFVVNWIGE